MRLQGLADMKIGRVEPILVPVWGNKTTWAPGIRIQLYLAAQGQAALVSVGRGQPSEAETSN